MATSTCGVEVKRFWSDNLLVCSDVATLPEQQPPYAEWRTGLAGPAVDARLLAGEKTEHQCVCGRCAVIPVASVYLNCELDY